MLLNMSEGLVPNQEEQQERWEQLAVPEMEKLHMTWVVGVTVGSTGQQPADDQVPWYHDWSVGVARQ